jgi:hypothetical protein
MRGTMLAEGKIKVEDLDRLVVTDSPDEAVRVIIDTYKGTDRAPQSLSATSDTH